MFATSIVILMGSFFVEAKEKSIQAYTITNRIFTNTKTPIREGLINKNLASSYGDVQNFSLPYEAQRKRERGLNS